MDKCNKYCSVEYHKLMTGDCSHKRDWFYCTLTVTIFWLYMSLLLMLGYAVSLLSLAVLTLTVPVTTIDALQHLETG